MIILWQFFSSLSVKEFRKLVIVYMTKIMSGIVFMTNGV